MIVNNLWSLDSTLKLKFDEEKYKAISKKCREDKLVQKCVICQKTG